jgi:hypothetical protein
VSVVAASVHDTLALGCVTLARRLKNGQGVDVGTKSNAIAPFSPYVRNRSGSCTGPPRNSEAIELRADASGRFFFFPGRLWVPVKFAAKFDRMIDDLA